MARPIGSMHGDSCSKPRADRPGGPRRATRPSAFPRVAGSLVALDGCSLEVPAGSFTVVIGPNGCGKSTLLRLIAGLLRPDGGQVTIGGDPRGPPRAGDGRVGIAFQQPRLLPWLSTLDNVALPLALRGEPRRTTRERARPRGAGAGGPGRRSRRAAARAVRRNGAARRPGAGADRRPAGAAARRAVLGARRTEPRGVRHRAPVALAGAAAHRDPGHALGAGGRAPGGSDRGHDRRAPDRWLAWWRSTCRDLGPISLAGDSRAVQLEAAVRDTLSSVHAPELTSWTASS